MTVIVTVSPPGFTGDGFTCADVDECLDGIATCDIDATCTNSIGSYSCACDPGYRGSGFDCADIDECAESTHGCGTNESCVNQIGMPNTCVCRPGFMRPDPMSECETSCGDGFVAPGEACDDANMTSDDGCSSICDIEPGWVCFEPTGAASTCKRRARRAPRTRPACAATWSTTTATCGPTAGTPTA